MAYTPSKYTIVAQFRAEERALAAATFEYAKKMFAVFSDHHPMITTKGEIGDAVGELWTYLIKNDSPDRIFLVMDDAASRYSHSREVLSSGVQDFRAGWAAAMKHRDEVETLAAAKPKKRSRT